MTTIEASLAGIRSVFGRVIDLWDRIGAWTNAQMPKGLYARSLLIIVTPMVLLQSVVAFITIEPGKIGNCPRDLNVVVTCAAGDDNPPTGRSDNGRDAVEGNLQGR